MTPPDPHETPWYQKAFGADYLARYAHRDEQEARQAVELVLKKTSLPTQARHFDLACGAGRHLAIFQEAGLQAVGGDLSLPLLWKAREQELSVMQLDMRYIPLQDHSVDLVTNFFTAFGYFDQDEENFSVFTEVARLLKPGGWFAFDFLNGPLVANQLRNLAQPVMQEEINGQEWVIRKGLSPDGKRAEKSQKLLKNQQTIKESVRLFSPEELMISLNHHGLQVVHQFGNYQGDTFDPEASPRCFLICQHH
jgi:SAM-dependent methyltransferase